MASFSSGKWQWENAAAGAVSGFATVALMHPLDVVRTRFQVNDGRATHIPTYKNTAHAVYTISRTEGLRGLYAGFYPAVLGSTVSWGLYFFFYSRAKERYSKNREEKLTPGLHLASAAEAGALVSLCTNPIWLVKTRLQLQTPLHQSQPYSGLHGLLPELMRKHDYSPKHPQLSAARAYSLYIFIGFHSYMSDAFKTILKEEGWRALYKGFLPSLFLISHGAIQFTAYEELRKAVVEYKYRKILTSSEADDQLNSVDYAALGASSKFAAILVSYPLQVIRSRLQQRPSNDGIPRYMHTWHVVKETARFEGLKGFYRGITPNILKNAPAASITFVVYENVLKLLKSTRTE